jgi:hypothetical protein
MGRTVPHPEEEKSSADYADFRRLKTKYLLKTLKSIFTAIPVRRTKTSTHDVF